MKRGGLEEVMVSHIFQAFTSVISTSTSRTPTLTSTLLVPLHWTFHPLYSKEALENVWMNAQSFLFTNPRGVSPVWYWISGGQFTLYGASLVSLSSGVCSFRVVMHLGLLSKHDCTERSQLLLGQWEKVSFSGRLLSILSTGSSWGRKGCP